MSRPYLAAAYARASKDDADSATITNQIGLIRDYAASVPEIQIVSVREDNGFSGVDFFRPSFGEMMRDLEAGIINCVIVKDLSRLGRNYIEVGELMDVIFPRMGVRLISVNDRYDSLSPRSDAEEILIPFKNLINEQYLRDFSVKIRSHLSVRRKNGDFVAAFAPYGYRRTETGKHRLVIDEHAAEVVQDIFRWKTEGQSAQNIAARLNALGEPSPAEYQKRSTRYRAQFQTHARASWSAVAVGRILRNPVYTGTLIQGRETTPNFKVRKRVRKPESEWSIVQGTHEAIISRSDFETVAGLLARDTRTAPGNQRVYPLSGIVFCGDCGNSAVRKTVGTYSYYACASAKAGKGCTFHYVRQNELERAVLEAVAGQIACLLDTEGFLRDLDRLPGQRRDASILAARIEDRERELCDCLRYRQSLYEDCRSGLISEEDFAEFGQDYTTRIEELRRAVSALRQEAEGLLNRPESDRITRFRRERTVSELSRELAVHFLDRIDVYEGRRISLRFRYRDKLDAPHGALGGTARGAAAWPE